MTGKSRQKDEVPEEGAAAETSEEPKVEEKKDPLVEAQAKAEQYLDMARRLQADFDNYRKRSQRENEEYRKYACSSIVSDQIGRAHV